MIIVFARPEMIDGALSRSVTMLAGVIGLILGCDPSETVLLDWTETRDSTGFRSLVESPSMCGDCIVLERLVVLGDTSGPGYVEETQDVTQDSLGNYWVSQPHFGVKVFDSAGNFLLQVGRGGEGPMEFRRPGPVHTDSEGKVHILDIGNRRETVVDADFQLYADRPTPGLIRAAVPLTGGGRYAVNMWVPSAERIGLPLNN